MSESQLNRSLAASIDRALGSRPVRRRAGTLSLSQARRETAREDRNAVLLVPAADRDALETLRAEGISYHVEETGETFLTSPVASNRQWRPQIRAGLFSRRASRIARWLLLHPENAYTITELAHAARVDKSVASRAVKALAREAFVQTEPSSNDWRALSVSLAAPAQLLDAWRSDYRRRRPIPQRFDIGTRTVRDTLRTLAGARDWTSAPAILSGLAGAATRARTVEPADVLLLTTDDGRDEWQRALLAEPSVERGLLQIAVTSDPYLFELADAGASALPAADPVQLWLDTVDGGERAAVAAAAIAAEMGWT